MLMLAAAAMATAATTAAVAAGWRFSDSTRGAGGKYRQFFRQPGRAATRAFGAFPVAGTHQQLAVLLALGTMKLVNRHELNLTKAGD